MCKNKKSASASERSCNVFWNIPSSFIIYGLANVFLKLERAPIFPLFIIAYGERFFSKSTQSKRQIHRKNKTKKNKKTGIFVNWYKMKQTNWYKKEISFLYKRYSKNIQIENKVKNLVFWALMFSLFRQQTFWKIFLLFFR